MRLVELSTADGGIIERRGRHARVSEEASDKFTAKNVKGHAQVMRDTGAKRRDCRVLHNTERTSL